MSPDDLVESLINELVAEEQAKLLGPECSTTHTSEGAGDWSRCEVCARFIRRENGAWKVYHNSDCECRDCRTKWSKPTDAAPRFDMGAVSKGTLVTMDPDHRLGANGQMGTGHQQGRWRVGGFWRPIRKGDDGYSMRYEGQTLVQCDPESALYVSMSYTCGVMLRADDFRAHATITGHINDPR